MLKSSAFAFIALLLCSSVLYADGDLDTKFLNQGTVGNTRHNLTQHQAAGAGPAGLMMDFVRNDYGEVCVYCHTPHGANTTINAPL